jgi:uroporphyrinogen decarboxylase
MYVRITWDTMAAGRHALMAARHSGAACPHEGLSMAAMTSRERALAAFAHREPDRIPIDIAATGASLIHRRVYEGVMSLWGLPPEPDLGTSKTSGMVYPGEAFRRRVGADFRQVGLECLEAWEQTGSSTYLDEWGVTWERSDGGEPAALNGPFQKAVVTVAEIERYAGYPQASDPRRYPDLRQRVTALRSETEYAVVFDFHYGLIRECQRLRGFAEWLTDLLDDEAIARALMEKVLETITGMAEHALDEIGDQIDVFLFYDDMGFQDRPYMRPAMYRELVKPYHARFLEAVRRKTKAHIMMHNDGAIRDLLGDYIEMGVEALNPVQVSADGMGDTAALKAEFGRDLLWWGAIDTQQVLPFGSPERVKDEVRRRLDTLGPGGGYVLAPGHNIQADVPAANVVAMLEAAAEMGTYPLI